jgi:hypothetical protein
VEEDEEVNQSKWADSGFGEGEGKNNYTLFLSLFVKCFVVDDQKGKDSGRTHYELLGSYMTVALEALAVAIYTNSYKKFLRLHWQHDTGELSSVSARSGLGSLSSSDTLFTSEALRCLHSW